MCLDSIIAYKYTKCTSDLFRYVLKSFNFSWKQRVKQDSFQVVKNKIWEAGKFHLQIFEERVT